MIAFHLLWEIEILNALRNNFYHYKRDFILLHHVLRLDWAKTSCSLLEFQGASLLYSRLC